MIMSNSFFQGISHTNSFLQHIPNLANDKTTTTQYQTSNGVVESLNQETQRRTSQHDVSQSIYWHIHEAHNNTPRIQ